MARIRFAQPLQLEQNPPLRVLKLASPGFISSDTARHRHNAGGRDRANIKSDGVLRAPFCAMKE